jgi:hypothetical protein
VSGSSHNINNNENKDNDSTTPSGSSVKVDILAPYLIDFPPNKPLDSIQAEFVAKKCKNGNKRFFISIIIDFRKRLLDRASIIQKRLEEEQDLLKKKRAQMQRRAGENVPAQPAPVTPTGTPSEKNTAADSGGDADSNFERYQASAMFRIQILEQRLAR